MRRRQMFDVVGTASATDRNSLPGISPPSSGWSGLFLATVSAATDGAGCASRSSAGSACSCSRPAGKSGWTWQKRQRRSGSHLDAEWPLEPHLGESQLKATRRGLLRKSVSVPGFLMVVNSSKCEVPGSQAGPLSNARPTSSPSSTAAPNSTASSWSSSRGPGLGWEGGSGAGGSGAGGGPAAGRSGVSCAASAWARSEKATGGEDTLCRHLGEGPILGCAWDATRKRLKKVAVDLRVVNLVFTDRAGWPRTEREPWQEGPREGRRIPQRAGGGTGTAAPLWAGSLSSWRLRRSDGEQISCFRQQRATPLLTRQGAGRALLLSKGCSSPHFKVITTRWSQSATWIVAKGTDLARVSSQQLLLVIILVELICHLI